MTKKLKPCPFCGNEVELKFNWGSRPDKTKEWGIFGHKKECFLFGQSKMLVYSNKQESIDAWNTRAKGNQ